MNMYINDVISDIYGIHNKAKSKVTFNVVSALKIIDKAVDLFQKEKSVLEIELTAENTDIAIVGDIHGNINSLISIFQKKGDPTTTKYLFLGDYVDRGKNSCEVIVLLYAFKCLYPDNIYLIRGNHEFREMNDYYGFKNECIKRINSKQDEADLFYEKATNSFQFLPLCAILNNRIFCVHGGITGMLKNRDELMRIKKVGNTFCSEDSVAAEFLWNDPESDIDSFIKSQRGLGCIFGENALNQFLEKMDFDFVIRSHQNAMNGYLWNFGKNGKILTVFSSIDYCGQSNDAAIALISNENQIKTMKFDFYPVVLLPERIIENNFAFYEIVTLNPDLMIDQVPCLI